MNYELDIVIHTYSNKHITQRNTQHNTLHNENEMYGIVTSVCLLLRVFYLPTSHYTYHILKYDTRRSISSIVYNKYVV